MASLLAGVSLLDLARFDARLRGRINELVARALSGSLFERVFQSIGSTMEMYHVLFLRAVQPRHVFIDFSSKILAAKAEPAILSPSIPGGTTIMFLALDVRSRIPMGASELTRLLLSLGLALLVGLFFLLERPLGRAMGNLHTTCDEKADSPPDEPSSSKSPTLEDASFRNCTLIRTVV